MKLKNERHECFCYKYIIDLNGTQAAIRAGYSEKTARVTVAKLLTKANIQNRISKLQGR
ncbi:terminase small subunit [Anaeropeptidivorans aminofermentans]|uniref:terminase small subunit n=1 Tax=Anaeropeptidivorans aminofermentans TaxID=2934315 RepID=UPI0020246424|nr:terminase small subunit [Anaeropeptidivorans aminofermentans]